MIVYISIMSYSALDIQRFEIQAQIWTSSYYDFSHVDSPFAIAINELNTTPQLQFQAHAADPGNVDGESDTEQVNEKHCCSKLLDCIVACQSHVSALFFVL